MGIFFKIDKSISFNKIYLEFIQMGGDFGINCFVMISSYFIIDSTFEITRLLKLILKIWSYTFGIMLIFLVFNSKINGLMFIKSLIPLTTNLFWFASAYTIFYSMTPFLNNFIRNCNRKAHFKVISLNLLIWCLIPIFLPYNFYYTEILWFITLYLCISYIKIYNPLITTNLKQQITVALTSCLFILVSIIIFSYMSDKFFIFDKYITFYERRNRLPMFLFSLNIFLLFKNMNITSNNIVNTVASTTFGVYLIQDTL